MFVFVSASAIWCAETPTCFDASLTEVDVSKMWCQSHSQKSMSIYIKASIKFNKYQY